MTFRGRDGEHRREGSCGGLDTVIAGFFLAWATGVSMHTGCASSVVQVSALRLHFLTRQRRRGGCGGLIVPSRAGCRFILISRKKLPRYSRRGDHFPSG